MAHIFKYPTPGQKGILVFSHKEARYFEDPGPLGRLRNKVERRLGRQAPGAPAARALRGPILSDMAKLRDDYFIGIHYGWHFENPFGVGWSDFALASPSTLTNTVPSIRRIPVTSNHFTPEVYYRKTEPDRKYWDVINVSRQGKFKKVDTFMQEIRKIYDLGYAYKVLLVTPTAKDADPERTFTEMCDVYYDLFSADERELFTLLKLDPELHWLGLSQTQIAHFYQSSKVLTLFSQKEGVAKVVNEALASSLVVVTKDDLTGGGADFLNETNAVTFPDYDEAHRAIIDAVESYDERWPDLKPPVGISQSEGLEKIKAHFVDLYADHGQNFDGELVNTDHLNRRMNAHFTDVPWSRGRFVTADIVNREQWAIFMGEARRGQ